MKQVRRNDESIYMFRRRKMMLNYQLNEEYVEYITCRVSVAHATGFKLVKTKYQENKNIFGRKPRLEIQMKHERISKTADYDKIYFGIFVCIFFCSFFL